jgi:dihydrofolate reductase
MSVAAIWAQTQAGVIGAQGQLPWHVPEDLRHFAQLTTGHTVLMGRRTWDGLPPRFRPLPNRRNLVLTRDAAWREPGAQRVGDVADAVASHGADLWVIGGRAVFDLAWPWVTRVETTVLDLDVVGDTFAPVLDPKDWHRLAGAAASDWHTSATGVRYRFDSWRRLCAQGGIFPAATAWHTGLGPSRT